MEGCTMHSFHRNGEMSRFCLQKSRISAIEDFNSTTICYQAWLSRAALWLDNRHGRCCCSPWWRFSNQRAAVKGRPGSKAGGIMFCGWTALLDVTETLVFDGRNAWFLKAKTWHFDISVERMRSTTVVPIVCSLLFLPQVAQATDHHISECMGNFKIVLKCTEMYWNAVK